MDPLSISASIIAVIQITTVVSTHCMQYVKSAKNVEGEAMILVREVGGLKIVLETLKRTLDRGKLLHNATPRLQGNGLSNSSSTLVNTNNDNNGNADDLDDPYLLPTLRKVCEMDKMFDECKEKLSKLANDIAPWKALEHRTTKEALIRALKWPLKESSMRKVLDDISNYITYFSLALSLDETNATLDILQITKDTNRVVKTIQSVQESEAKNKLAEDIVRWLAAPDPSTDYAHALQQRTKNTGSWLLQREQYTHWRATPGSLLWLYGTVGCGKTVLSSNVVEDLNRHSEAEPKKALVYFYFKMDDTTKRTSENMLRAIIKQLFENLNRQSDALQTLYDQLKTQNSITETQLLSAFREMASTFGSVYVVLDALDECQNRNDLFNFLEEIGSWQDINIHLLLTSRDERDITEAIEAVELAQSWIKLTAAVLKEDVRTYISSRLQTDRAFKRWSKHPEVQRDIEDSLTTKSDGMFQWVVCQVEALVKCIRPPQLRKALNSLPETLYDTYAEMLAKIHDENYEVALRMFHWLLFSNRPLSIEELAELAAMDFGDDCPTIQRFWDPAEILKICPGFLTTIEEFSNDQKSGETRTFIRIAHISIREYLMSSEIGKSRVSRYQITTDSAHADITESCLQYMQLIDQPFATVSHEDFPLASYTMGQWLVHYRNVPESDEQLHESVYDFFVNHKEVYMKWADYFFPNIVHDHKDELRTYVLKSPLNTAAAFSLIQLLKLMFSRNEIDTTSNAVLKDALYASYLGVTFPRPPGPNLDVTRLLIEHGADFATDARYANTLHGASYYGLHDLVKAELEVGVNVNRQGGKFASALDAAIAGRHQLNFLRGGTRLGQYLESIEPSCIKTLLEHGADPNVCRGNKGTPLLLSSSIGDIVVVKILLAHGADPNFHLPRRSGMQFDRSCLSSACSSKDLRIVKLLVEHGASVHSSCSLASACWSPQLDIVEYLLENGASPNGSEDEGDVGSPLQIACSNGSDAIVELLLQHGADVHLGRGHAGSPLNEAAIAGSVPITKRLIEKGANVNMIAGHHGTALQAAANMGEIDVAECLIKNGADVNIRAGFFKTALQAALLWPHANIVTMLLRSGADVDVKSPYGSTLVEALRNAPTSLCEVHVEQYSTKTSQSVWRAVRRPVHASFTDFDALEILELNSPMVDNDPAFLCSLDPL
ncbi:Ankyrin repeat and KH domain-containing protein 1 [Talaromyces pinophilus]|nr:Ankyrin repeat and KH domain-containing protein 1 [Talaromyces pinophilus]